MLIGVLECCCGCPKWSDEFNRPDSEDPGEKWEELESDWDIAANTLKETGNKDSRCRFKPLLSIGWLLSVDAVDPTPGSVYRVLLTWDPLNKTTWFGAEFEFVSPTWTVRIVNCIEDVRSVEMTVENLAAGKLYVCRSRTLFAAWVGEVPRYAYICQSESSRQIALQNGTDSPIQWDNLLIYEHLRANNDPRCPDCACTCQGHCITRRLHGVLWDQSHCSGFHGKEFTLTWHWAAFACSTWGWLTESGDEVQCVSAGGIPRAYPLSLCCLGADEPPDNFTLQMQNPDVGPWCSTTWNFTIVEAHCNPLYILAEYKCWVGLGGVGSETCCDNSHDPNGYWWIIRAEITE